MIFLGLKKHKLIEKWISSSSNSENIHYMDRLFLEEINPSLLKDKNWIQKSIKYLAKIDKIKTRTHSELHLVLSVLLPKNDPQKKYGNINFSDFAGSILEQKPVFSLMTDEQFTKLLEIGKSFKIDFGCCGLSTKIVEWRDKEDPTIVHRAMYFFLK